ncbi:MAG: hypothetical protein JWP83_5316 [Mycobacterium sp.]|jgi:hypothetical protein|nr:hypothetical protein [Mycobacterium sp.]
MGDSGNDMGWLASNRRDNAGKIAYLRTATMRMSLGLHHQC